MSAAASLSPRQVGATCHAAARELVWALPAMASEVGAWRARAIRIPDGPLREDALRTLERKRTHTAGAALFATIPQMRDLRLLRALVCFEILLDFFDDVNERAAASGQVNGRQLQLALIDAVDATRPISDYYRYNPWRNDDGYARALVEACRRGCSQLPSYEQVRPQLAVQARRTQVLGVNHEPHATRRDAALRKWVNEELDGQAVGLAWFELAAAASGTLAVHALLALAAEPTCSSLAVEQVSNVYYPWASAAATLLDSYVDQAEDAARDVHSYVGHYDTSQIALQRMRWLIQRSLTEAHALPNGERHVLIIACMVAMFLSKDSARASTTHSTTAGLTAAGGSLTRALLPILRLWRTANGLRSA
jgi:tetraprenyl-beta-curcumene synthase